VIVVEWVGVIVGEWVVELYCVGFELVYVVQYGL